MSSVEFLRQKRQFLCQSGNKTACHRQFIILNLNLRKSNQIGAEFSLHFCHCHNDVFHFVIDFTNLLHFGSYQRIPHALHQIPARADKKVFGTVFE